MSDIVLTASARFRSLFAVIVAMGVTSAIYSLSLPLFAARLDDMGHSEFVIGVNSAAQAIALIVVAPFGPRLLRHMGPAVLMLWMLALTFVFVLLCPLYENAWYWLVMRLLLGASTGLLWIAGEAWINEASEDTSRGRILALYGISGAGGTMAGFAILYLTGFNGWLPFIIIEALIVLCCFAVGGAVKVAPPFHGTASQTMLGLAFRAPTPMIVNLLVAITFGSLASFLPVYGPDVGLPRESVFLLLALLSAGGLLQYPIGWLADRMDRRLLAILVMAVMAVLFAVMPAALADPLLRWPYVVILGGGMMGLYTLGLTLLGARFRGVDLGAATTLFQVMWNTGMVAGPFAVGFAMDSAGAGAFPWTMVGFYAAVIVFIAARGRRRSDT
jgi:MFS family permease